MGIILYIPSSHQACFSHKWDVLGCNLSVWLCICVCVCHNS